VLAKIEKPKALASLHGILELADALMVARGDLGVEMPLERVPGLQKQITRAARKAGKPVVVATQMLESMISSPVPTRAEVSDVAQAVYEGADAVMLSAESASGAYPEAAVAMMDRIARSAENEDIYRQIIESQRGAPDRTVPDAIMAAVHEVTETIEARAILCWSTSGVTVLRAARERPRAPIIAATPSLQTARRMALVWGTHAVVTPDITSVDEMVGQAVTIATREGLPRKAIISSSPPAFPSASRAAPTCCGWQGFRLRPRAGCNQIESLFLILRQVQDEDRQDFLMLSLSKHEGRKHA